MREMKRVHYIAAEVFGYSYDNYQDHLEGGNACFTRYMPDDISTLERAAGESWDRKRLAKALAIGEDKVEGWLRACREGKDSVDTPDPVQAFRKGVGYSIKHALEGGLEDEDSIQRLITQICYRVADLGSLIKHSGKQLADYSEKLRDETEADAKFNTEWFNRQFPSRVDDQPDENEA